MEYKKSKTSLEDKLKDAGFDNQEIEEFCSDDSKECRCKCLDSKRKKLLDKIHQKEKQINCIDYLQYELNKETKEN